MIYISKEAAELLERIEEFLKKNLEYGRIIRADILSDALKCYAEKLGLEANKK